MSILSQRKLNKVSPAALGDKPKKKKTKRVVVFTDDVTPGIRGADVTENALTDYAKKNTVKTKIGVGSDKGKKKHILKVPKNEFYDEKPIFKPSKTNAEGFYTPTTPFETKKLTKYNRRVGQRFITKEKQANKIDKKIDAIENKASRGNPFGFTNF